MSGCSDEAAVDETARARAREVRLVRLRAIAAGIRANLPDDVTSDHGWLYDDETGLPK